MKPRIYHDFNKLDHRQWAILVCLQTTKDLEASGIELREGLEVVLYMPDDVDERGNPDCLGCVLSRVRVQVVSRPGSLAKAADRGVAIGLG